MQAASVDDDGDVVIRLSLVILLECGVDVTCGRCFHTLANPHTHRQPGYKTWGSWEESWTSWTCPQMLPRIRACSGNSVCLSFVKVMEEVHSTSAGSTSVASGLHFPTDWTTSESNFCGLFGLFESSNSLSTRSCSILIHPEPFLCRTSLSTPVRPRLPHGVLEEVVWAACLLPSLPQRVWQSGSLPEVRQMFVQVYDYTS